jgi:hypothetical protein
LAERLEAANRGDPPAPSRFSPRGVANHRSTADFAGSRRGKLALDRRGFRDDCGISTERFVGPIAAVPSLYLIHNSRE